MRILKECAFIRHPKKKGSAGSEVTNQRRRKEEEKTAVLAEPGYKVNNIRAAIPEGRRSLFVEGKHKKDA